MYFSNFADQRLYRQAAGGAPDAADAGRPTRRAAWRYADGVIDASRAALDRRARGARADGRVDNTIVAVDLAAPGPGPRPGRGPRFLRRAAPVAGRQAPRLAALEPPEHAVGRHRIVGRRDRRGRRPRRAAQDRRRRRASRSASRNGRPTACCISSPTAPAGGTSTAATRRAARSARSARARPNSAGRNGCSASRATPFFGPTSIVCTYGEGGRDRAGPARHRHRQADPARPALQRVRLDPASPAAGSSAAPARRPGPARSSSSTRRPAPSRCCANRRPPPPTPSCSAISRSPRHLEFPTENGLTAFANYYPPPNPDFAAPAGEKPPLVVKCHGGPTSSALVER